MDVFAIKASALLMVSLAAICGMPVHAQYLEDNKGYVIMEAENTKSPLDKWAKGMLSSTKFTGSGHIEFTGNNPSSGPATSPLEYKFTIAKAGVYALYLRIWKNLKGEAGDKCNDVYVKVTGDYNAADGAILETLQSDNKLFGGDSLVFMWSGAVSLDQSSKYFSPRYTFKAGQSYTLTISGRAQRANLDRILFVMDDQLATGQNPFTPESSDKACSGNQCYPDSTKLAANFIYKAIPDFKKITTPPFVSYTDEVARGSVSINASVVTNRLKWAAAEVAFTGPDGNYSLELSGMKETDGETSYRLSLNGTQIGTTFKNESINLDSARDYEIQKHKVPSITLKKGDLIRVESDCASNSKVVEGAGFAWARGRWTQIEAKTLSPATLHPRGMINHQPLRKEFGGLVFYPNHPGEYTLAVYNFIGKRHQTTNYSIIGNLPSGIRIDTKTMTPGVYFVSVTGGGIRQQKQSLLIR